MPIQRAAAAAAFLCLTLILCGPLCSCVEITITSASVVAGPAAKGALTLEIVASIAAEEGMLGEGEDLASQEPTRNAIGYVAVGIPARVDTGSVRLSGPTAMVGEGNARVMGRAPQVARIYETEFPGDDVRWVAYHVILDEVDLRQPQTVTLQLELTAAPTGVSTIWIAPGSIDDGSSTPVPVTPTALELAVGSGKATVRVVPPAIPAAEKGVQA